jgi:hypothetical protein
MTEGRPSRHPIRTLRWLTAGLAVVILLAPSIAVSGERDRSRAPGYVDGSEFAALASGEDDELVEISVSGALLSALAKGIGGNGNGVGQLVAGLDWIGAVIAGAEGQGDRASKLVRKKESDLLGKGWERLAMVKEAGSYVSVLIRHDEDVISGLVVMVKEDDQVVFTNIAGVLDLALIGQLGSTMDIPGLEHVKPPDTDKPDGKL